MSMKPVIAFFLVSFANGNIQPNNKQNDVISIPDSERHYKAIWDDLDTRPLPQWYDRAKVGIFIHWGLYAVPSFGSEWFWMYWHSNESAYVDFMKKNYRSGYTYQDFAPEFTAEFFDPNQWADIFSKSGARYVVLTSKHHEGYTLFPSKRSFGWNSVDVGPRRDIVGELSKAVREKQMKFGIYYSLYEWFNPMYLEDKKNQFNTSTYASVKLRSDIKQLVEDYEPSVIWADGDWEASDTYWNSTELLAWLYNDTPVKNEVVVNDRWGIGIPCKHGDFYNCQDRYSPGKVQNHKWENAFTLDKTSWGHRRNISFREVMTSEELLKELASTVSCGGNVLINIGPTKEGTIIPIFQERLLTLGKWLEINGEAIYASSPWKHQNDTKNPDVWYTCTKTRYNSLKPTENPGGEDIVTAIYALVLNWPEDGILVVGDIAPYLHSGNYKAKLLGNEGNYLNWTIESGIAKIKLPNKATVKSERAWTVKFSSK